MASQHRPEDERVGRWSDAALDAYNRQRKISLADQIKARRADYRRRNLASLALTMSLIGCLLFVTAPVGIILGFACLRGGDGQPRPGERVAMWAIILGLVPISVVAAVLVERFVTGHH
jgi:hypothetical protein